jgi:hypothetical protein
VADSPERASNAPGTSHNIHTSWGLRLSYAALSMLAFLLCLSFLVLVNGVGYQGSSELDAYPDQTTALIGNVVLVVLARAGRAGRAGRSTNNHLCLPAKVAKLPSARHKPRSARIHDISEATNVGNKRPLTLRDNLPPEFPSARPISFQKNNQRSHIVRTHYEDGFLSF